MSPRDAETHASRRLARGRPQSWLVRLRDGHRNRLHCARSRGHPNGVGGAARDRPDRLPASARGVGLAAAGLATATGRGSGRPARLRLAHRGGGLLRPVGPAGSRRPRTVAAVLLAVGEAGWLLLGYGIPLAMIASTSRRPCLGQVNGTWFIWAVGTQSVAVACAALDRLTPHVWLAVLASVCWAIGIVQHLLTAALVLARLLVHPVGPDDLIPPYWVFMGAAAISVLAGSGLLALPPTQRLLPGQVTEGLCLMLWAFCTWLIPLLIGLGVWRHVLRRVPLRYETGLWSLVFPVGMYGFATRQLGHATGTSWLTAIGAGEAWVALAVWALVFLAMLASAIRAWAAGRSHHWLP
ncbi:tellurite resistance/C4-dicarboxylate transporter family protein [Kitasatospora sp. NPDC001159]